MNNQDKRIHKTKSKLQNALISLLKAEKMQDITVSALCKEASVRRTTFYAHYDTPNDVLHEIYESILQENLNSISVSGYLLDYKAMVLKTCQLLYEHKEFSMLFLNAQHELFYLNLNSMEASNKAINVAFRERGVRLNEQDLHDLIRYTTGGTFLLVRDWCVNGMTESPEEIAEKINVFNELIHNTFLNQKSLIPSK